MKKWKIPLISQDLRCPDQILQEFADALAIDTNNILVGQVAELISYDSYDRPKLYYILDIYITKLKQSYKLIEVEQIGDSPYPINLKVVFYTGSEIFENIKDSEALTNKLEEIANNTLVGNLLAHLIRLSELKEEEE